MKILKQLIFSVILAIEFELILYGTHILLIEETNEPVFQF